MKKFFFSLAVALGVTSTAVAADVLNIGDVNYTVDTLYHAKVGPGTVQTSLVLNNQTNPEIKMRAFYFVVDLTNPYISIRNTVGQNKLPVGQTVSSMAKEHSAEGANYFAGINTDGFYQTGQTEMGEPIAGEPGGTNICDGEIFKIAAKHFRIQISIDDKGKPYFGYVNPSGEVIVGNKKMPITKVNLHTVAETGVSLYSHRYFKFLDSPQCANNISEVCCKLVSGKGIQVGEETVLEVIAAPTHTGAVEIPQGGFVMAARDAECRAIIDNMKIGDQFKVNAKVEIEGIGNGLKVMQSMSGNPSILEDGKRIEYNYNLWNERHPRSAIGFSKDQKTLYMLLVDGRSAISSGATTNELSDMLKSFGASYGFNCDGGGSSTIYTEKFGVMNVPSDGHERPVGAASFVVANTPTDSVIAEIRFVDWKMNMPKHGIFTPKFLGYNKYGVMVDTDVKGVKISCSSKIGTIINEGTTLYGDGEGSEMLTAEYNGLKASIPVNIVSSGESHIRLQNVVLDNVREYPIEINAKVSDGEMPISPMAYTWVTDNEAVATIGADGVLRGVANGTAKITGTKDGKPEELNVTVQIPEAAAMPVCYPAFPTNWTLKQVGGKDLAIAELENGFKLDYVGRGAARGAYIKVDCPLTVWSLPEAFRLRINPGEATINSISMSVEDAMGTRLLAWNFTEKALAKNTESVYEINLSDWTTPTDLGVYPIKINGLNFKMGTSAKDKAFTISVPGFEALYSEKGGVDQNTVADTEIAIYPNPIESGEALTVKAEGKATVEIYSLNGTMVLTTEIDGTESLEIPAVAQGIYLVRIADGKQVKTSKLIVK